MTAPRHARWGVVSALVMCLLVPATLTIAAQVPSARDPELPSAAPSQPSAHSDLVTRAYDVRDLLITVPDFDDAPDLTVFNLTDGREAGEPIAAAPVSKSKSAPTHQQALTNLERIIMDEIDSASWRDRGGSVGSLRENPKASGQLMVTQTPDNQTAIQHFIQDLRSARTIQVTVEARFITGDGAFARLAQIAGQKRWEANGQYQLWPGYLSEAQMKRLLAWQQMDKTSTLLAAPRITLFNGQRTYVLVSQTTAFVSGFAPDNAWVKPAGFKPQVSTLQSGIMFDCAATASADRKNVALVLRPQSIQLENFTLQRWSAAPPHRDELIVQVPHLRVVQMKTTTSIPDGKTAVYRLRPQRKPPSTTQPAADPVMLLITPRIIRSAPQPGGALSPTTQPIPTTSSQSAKGTPTPNPS